MMTTEQSAAEIRQQAQHDLQAAQDAQAQAARAAGREITIQGGGIGGNGGQRIIISPPVPPTPPGFYTSESGFQDRGIPSQVVDISIAFFVMCGVIAIGWPLARAFGKRIERRAAEPASLNPQMADQLQRIEQAVDAMSVEIERISESQRFMAKLQNQGASAALPGERR